MPGFNIENDDNERWFFVQLNGQIAPRASPTKMHPLECYCSLIQSKDKVTFSEKWVMKARLFEKKNVLGHKIPSFMEIAVASN